MKIIMGNDEFILYLRKRHPNCNKENDLIGKTIWQWLQENDPKSIKIQEDMPCIWGESANNVSGLMLPKTATQFQFNRNLLPQLYNFIDTI